MSNGFGPVFDRVMFEAGSVDVCEWWASSTSGIELNWDSEDFQSGRIRLSTSEAHDLADRLHAWVDGKLHGNLYRAECSLGDHAEACFVPLAPSNNGNEGPF